MERLELQNVSEHFPFEENYRQAQNRAMVRFWQLVEDFDKVDEALVDRPYKLYMIQSSHPATKGYWIEFAEEITLGPYDQLIVHHPTKFNSKLQPK